MTGEIKIACISGSLRKGSFHTGLIRHGYLLLITTQSSILFFSFIVNNSLLSSFFFCK